MRYRSDAFDYLQERLSALSVLELDAYALARISSDAYPEGDTHA